MYFSHGVVVVGAYPNHYLSINEVKGEGIKLFLQECLYGLHVQLVSEIKVCIISFQNTPQGMFPYFSLIDHHQTINESNDLYTTFLKEFDIASTQAGNMEPLNISTYGVACEI